MDAAPTRTRRGGPGRIAIAFGYLGGAIAWTLHLIGAYLIAEFGCIGQKDHHQIMGINAVAWWALLLTVFMIGASVLSILVSWWGYRRAGAEHATILRAESHMMRTGMIMNAVFLLIILAQAVPIFYYLESC